MNREILPSKWEQFPLHYSTIVDARVNNDIVPEPDTDHLYDNIVQSNNWRWFRDVPGKRDHGHGMRPPCLYKNM